MSGVVSSVIGYKSGKKAADAQVKAAKIAARQFRPFNVSTALGTTELNEKGTAISADLSESAQGLLDLNVAEASQPYDVAAGQLFGRMQALAERGETDARRTTRERLFRAGRLGTAGGIREIGEVERALADARISREIGAFNTAMQMRQSAFNNAALLYQVPASNLISASINRNPAAAVAAQGMINAGNSEASRYLGMGAGLSQAVGQIGRQTGIDQWFNDRIGSIFNSGGGGNVSVSAPGAFGAFGNAGSMLGGFNTSYPSIL